MEPTSKRPHSKIIGRVQIPGQRGKPAYDREQIYRWLYENSDHRGIIIYNQREVAKRIDINYQNVCNIYSDFVRSGHLAKHGNFFEVVYDPDDLDWSLEFQKEQSAIRKRHQIQYNYQEGEING